MNEGKKEVEVKSRSHDASSSMLMLWSSSHLRSRIKNYKLLIVANGGIDNLSLIVVKSLEPLQLKVRERGLI